LVFLYCVYFCCSHFNPCNVNVRGPCSRQSMLRYFWKLFACAELWNISLLID
jgi:hypothetical protein